MTAIGAANEIAIDSASAIEVASVEVTPKAEANVVLNAHVTLESVTSTGGNYHIARGDCSGTVVALGAWQLNDDVAFLLLEGTFSATGADVVDTATTYVLCVEKGAAGFANAQALQRALTATWSPTA